VIERAVGSKTKERSKCYGVFSQENNNIKDDIKDKDNRVGHPPLLSKMIIF
jgi:hypothetical protein